MTVKHLKVTGSALTGIIEAGPWELAVWQNEWHR